MASSEEPARKKPATESSIDFRLCLSCHGDKFTNIKGDHQSGGAAATTSIGIIPTFDGLYTIPKPRYVRLNKK